MTSKSLYYCCLALLLACSDGLTQTPVYRVEPSSNSDLLLDEAALEYDEVEAPVRRFRRGFFQKSQLTGSWVGTGDSDDLTVSDVTASIGLAIPLGSLENLLVASPSFRVTSVDGVEQLGVPRELYEAGVQLFWRKSLNERWGAMVIAAPMVRSDMKTSDQAFRVFGGGFATWDWIPNELELAIGAVYLDRGDVRILPGVGIKWTPSPVWEYNLIFPRPRIAYRMAKDGSNSETWAYLAGTLGGNTWAVKRSSGETDELTIRDYRLAFGIEKIREGGRGWFFESGLAFGRTIEFESSPDEIDFDAAALVRAGLSF